MAYPIVFHGVRDGVVDVLEIPVAEQTERNLNRLTLILLTLLTTTALFVTDLGLINAVGGGLVATAIVFVFPTMMYRSAILQKRGGDRLELMGTAGLTLFGIVVGIIGACLAVFGTDAA